VFFNFGENDRIKIKIAHCLKFPYACENSNTFEEYTKVTHRSGIRSILPFRESVCDGLVYRTYFRIRSNEILYYNNFFWEGDPRRYNGDKLRLFWFMKDILRDTYHPVEFSKLNYFTDKNNSLLFRLRDKFYILSNELYKPEHIDTINPPNYVAIIDAESGKALYLENRKSNLYLDLFYLIANKIVPVIQMDNSSIKVHLVDIISQKINTLSWNIDKIDSIVMDMLYKSSGFKYMEDLLENIKFINFSKSSIKYIEYMHDVTSEQINYTKEIKVYFDIYINANEERRCNLVRLGVIMVLDHDSLECYLDFGKLAITIKSKERYREYHFIGDNPYENIRILPQKIYISSEILKIYLSNVLYSNECYNILYSTENGIVLKNKKLYTQRRMDTKLDVIWDIDNEFSNFTMYRHEDYLFIMKVPTHISPVFLIVIDLKSGRLYPFMSGDYFKTLLRGDLNYTFYYSKTSDNLIFLPTELQHIFIMDLRELNDKLYLLKQDVCEKEQYGYGYVDDFIEVFDLAELLSDAILRRHKLQIEDESVKALSYHIDKNLDKLYIVSKYNINNVDYIGIFECVTSEGSLFLKLVNYSPYNSILFSKNKGKNQINICNLNIRGMFVRNTFNNSLEIACNRNATFVDIWNNRISTRILQWSHTPQEIICENLGDYVIVELDPWEGAPRNKREFFVLSRLDLVNKMSVLTL